MYQKDSFISFHLQKKNLKQCKKIVLMKISKHCVNQMQKKYDLLDYDLEMIYYYECKNLYGRKNQWKYIM